jgi:hypothetical protein
MTRRRPHAALAIVSALAAAALVAAAGTPSAASAATVQTMVVGKDRVLRDAGPVRVKARRLTLHGRRCAVGRATPLSLLAGTGLRLRVKDFGSCGRSPRDAGGLFVTAVGNDRNRGRDGWVYKVGRRAGTAPAGDPSGPFGTGRRLRSSDRLLWFYCHMDTSGGCQRTLEARPDRRSAAPGTPLRVTVTGYDDAGNGAPVAGATVRLGAASAITAADGTVTLTVPGNASGRLAVRAERDGLVPSFPDMVRIG